ncbi:C2 domain [Trinorchestia longiramus]|nr:C2 domain [Trinorchestia longiramus]
MNNVEYVYKLLEVKETVKYALVPWERIRECQLNITVKDYDKLGRNEAIGKIMLGKAGSGTSETKHWSDMITKPRQTVVHWHRLKPE